MAHCDPRIILTAAGFLLLRRYEATVDCARGKKAGIATLHSLCGWKRTQRRHRLHITAPLVPWDPKYTNTHSNAAQPHRVRAPERTRTIHLNERNRQSAKRLPLVQRENPSHPNATITHHTITVYLALPHNHRNSHRLTSGLMVMRDKKKYCREDGERFVKEGVGSWVEGTPHSHLGDLGAREKQMTQRDEIKKNMTRPTQL